MTIVPQKTLKFWQPGFGSPLDSHLFWCCFSLLCASYIWLGLAQDVHFFYRLSHSSELQNCALILSTNFRYIFIFNQCTTQFSHWIVSCTKKTNFYRFFSKVVRTFVAIELIFFSKMIFFISISQESSHYLG